jgi:hypothetical protein
MTATGSAIWRVVPVCLALSAVTAQAQEDGSAAAADAPAETVYSDGGWLGNPAFSANFSGFVRAETAFSTTDRANPFNQQGNLFNGRPVNRTFVLGAGEDAVVVSDVATRFGDQTSDRVNLAILRARLEADIKLTSNLSLQAKMTAIVDPSLYNEHSRAEYDSQAVGKLYGRPNYFRYEVEGETHPNPLEWSGRNYLINFPALFLDYQNGPLNVRVGNQQIAWGQAIFFRVLDVPNGLDLRRHSLLDFASEEFSDKRVPSLAIRTSYQINDDWLVDAYVQKFQPTVYGNPNTQYNAIASQFTVHDLYGNYDSKFSYGMRFKGAIGDLGVQAIAARRYNPDGVFRWTESRVNRDIPGLPGTGAVLAQTAFEVDSTGVWSADEWFTYAGLARLNGVTGLNAAVEEFPAASLLGAFVVPTPDGDQSGYDLAALQLNTFFALAGGYLEGRSEGGLRGHLAREYKAETNLGGGLSYVINSEPGSLLDQLIINFEALYTPDRTFTDPSLRRAFLEQSEFTTALVVEKYQRFFTSVPATYLVAQWLHKTRSDLFGRSLRGMGGDQDTIAPGVSGGYDAVVFAMQQPFAQLIWRADLAVLYDTQGGLLVQPALRWKPNGDITVDMFYNYVNGHLSSPNKNALSTVDYADELTLRIGYQF